MGQGDPGRQDSADLTPSAIRTTSRHLETSVQNRIGTVIRAYAEQGVHRTGTDVDRQSAEWLANEVGQIGLEPALEEFSLNRVNPLHASLEVNGRKIDGLPLFDGGFTGAVGV